MSFTTSILRSIKRMFFPMKIVSWNRDQEEAENLIWRIPDDLYPDVNDIDQVLIKETERVAIFNQGSFKDTLAQGKHDIFENVDEIIFLDVSPKTLPFGIPRSQGPLTKDNKRVGFSGKISFSIQENPVSIGSFLTNYANGKKGITSEEFVTWLRTGPLLSVFRDILRDVTGDEFQGMDKFDILMELESKLGAELNVIGVEIDDLEITNIVQ